MIEKKVRARKNYTCDCCERKIKKGERYTLGKGREPLYTEDVMGNDVQDGIRYYQFRVCEDIEACNERAKLEYSA